MSLDAPNLQSSFEKLKQIQNTVEGKSFSEQTRVANRMVDQVEANMKDLNSFGSRKEERQEKKEKKKIEKTPINDIDPQRVSEYIQNQGFEKVRVSLEDTSVYTADYKGYQVVFQIQDSYGIQCTLKQGNQLIKGLFYRQGEAYQGKDLPGLFAGFRQNIDYVLETKKK